MKAKKYNLFIVIILGLLFIFCSRPGFSQEDVENASKKESPVQAESIKKLFELILKAWRDDDAQYLEKIEKANGGLIKENKLETIQTCGSLLYIAVESELKGQKERGEFILAAAIVPAKMYRDAVGSNYLMDKCALFGKWQKEEKEKYLEAKKLYDQGEELRKSYKYKEAVVCYDKGRMFYREIGYREGEANCLHRLGEVRRMLDDLKSAGQHYRECLNIFRDIQDRAGEVNTLQSLGEMHKNLSEHEKAREYYEQGLEISRYLNAPLGEANTLQSLGHMHWMLDENEKARLR
ncbi:MAG: tetratricopeptide repeat protein, partial [Candidatus Aminicenantes bacterium]|nr:tetratricopeptide repeat protein [Candidatus Aminicenantes bacterium]